MIATCVDKGKTFSEVNDISYLYKKKNIDLKTLIIIKK